MPVGLGAGLDDVGVERDPVDDCGDEAGVGDDAAPLAERQVAGQRSPAATRRYSSGASPRSCAISGGGRGVREEDIPPIGEADREVRLLIAMLRAIALWNRGQAELKGDRLELVRPDEAWPGSRG